ncbi:hypothetical protein V8C86DRAFT_2449885 [Haematococcus lacustris]
MPWAEVEGQLGHHANVERYCLWAHYVIALLGPQGLGLQPGQVQLGPGDAGWPLGALIQALSSHLPHLLHPGLGRPGTGAEPTCADLSPGSSLPVPAAESEPGTPDSSVVMEAKKMPATGTHYCAGWACSDVLAWASLMLLIAAGAWVAARIAGWGPSGPRLRPLRAQPPLLPVTKALRNRAASLPNLVRVV